MPPRLAAQAQRARLGRAHVADGVRRRRRDADRAGDLLRGVRPRPRAADGQRARPDDGRAGGHRARHRRAEGALPRADPVRRRDLVPGLLGAGVGLRPRVAEDARGARRRRLRRHRPEGVDDVRAPLEVVHAARAHEPRRAQAPRAHLLPDGHGAARASRSGRWSRSPARPSSTSSSSRRRGSRTRTSSAASTTAGAVAITTLMHERAGLAFALQARVQIALGELADELAGTTTRPARPRPLRAARHRGPGAAAARLPRADDQMKSRRARAGGLAGQVACGPTSTRR